MRKMLSAMSLLCKIVVFMTLISMITAIENNKSSTPTTATTTTTTATTTTTSSSTEGYDQEEAPWEVPDCPECKCGVSKLSDGQNKTKIHPWMAALFTLKENKKPFCGGATINDFYVLTAAHCVQDKKWVKDEVGVLLGDHHVVDKPPADYIRHLIRKVTDVTIHPGFDNVTYENDIALLKVIDWIASDENAQMVCLPPVGGRYFDLEATMIGWGDVPVPQYSNDSLRQVEMKVHALSDCQYGDHQVTTHNVTENMICAGDDERIFYKREEGSPLLYTNGYNETVLIGIASFNNTAHAHRLASFNNTAQANRPNIGVYTRVDKYLGWIGNNTEDACYCVL